MRREISDKALPDCVYAILCCSLQSAYYVATVIVTAWLVDAHFFQDPVVHMQSCRLCNLRASMSVQVHRDMARDARQYY